MKNYTLNGGIITGLTGICFTAVTYFMGVSAMVSIWSGILNFLIFLGIYLFWGFRYRSLNGGYLIFKEAVALIFFISVIATVLQGIFQIILYHVINPELPSMLHDAVVQNAIDWLQKMGQPQEKIDATLARIQENNGEFTVGMQIRAIGISFIGSGVVGLVIGLIIKKDPPPFEPVSDSSIQQ